MRIHPPSKLRRGCSLALAVAGAIAAGGGCGSSSETGARDAAGDGGAGQQDGVAAPSDSVAGPEAGNDSAVTPGWSQPVGPCNVRTLVAPSSGAEHIAACTPLTFQTSPPTSGTHYPQWPIFRVYQQPVPWGYLLHGMEHGAVVISYNCPDGCDADLQAATALVAATPAKTACVPPRPPVIMAPDPTLRSRFAAAAWGHALDATCFDSEQVAHFIAAHANKGPEYFPTDCGGIDQEPSGWCR